MPLLLELPQSDPSQPRLQRRNVVIHGRRTTINMEWQWWQALEEIYEAENMTWQDVCNILATRHSQSNNFTSDLRVFIFEYFWCGPGSKRAQGAPMLPPTLA